MIRDDFRFKVKYIEESLNELKIIDGPSTPRQVRRRASPRVLVETD